MSTLLLNDFAAGTPVNVGVILGGTTPNVVPAEASAHIDVRFRTPEASKQIEAQIRGLTPIAPDDQLIIEGWLDRSPMPLSPQYIALSERFEAELGFNLPAASIGGGSDGIFIAARGCARSQAEQFHEAGG